ncbi:sugar nucleotide-binding protein [Oceanobacter kriegii]|uniref:sugar nucleotide-binding protein n=1 Tax=Oceanobacter kriegii TaxID=64972 RepID=UPI000413322E|nr:sugar nucleotide-binding protein [Oceanobacter kriegii]
MNSFYSYVIGADRPIGQHLIKALAAENYLYKGLAIESQERVTLQSSGQPFFIITPSLFAAADLNELENWLELAEDNDAAVVFVSSTAVYPYEKDGRISEATEVFSEQAIAKGLLAAEARVRQTRRHLILRVGQQFSVSSGDFAHALLTQLRQDQSLSLDDQLPFSPTPEDDIASVLLAMLKQADCSDDLWGTYHFNGVEPVTSYAFAEALLSEASQYEDFTEVRLEIVAEEGVRPALMTANSEVEQLFHTFGIKKKPWRTGLSRLVRGYFRAAD